jgi:hypothetical protein
LIIYHDVTQGSPEWHDLRHGLWTGSKAIRLLQGKSMPRDYDFEGNKYTKRGHILEIIAVREYERRYRRKCLRTGFVTNTVYSNAGYSPDAIDGGWLLEIKAFNGDRHRELVAGNISLEILVQMFFGMIITGKRKARLLAVNPEEENQLTVIDIPYDKLIGNNIRAKLRLDMKNRQLLA